VPGGHDGNWITANEQWRSIRGGKLRVPEPGQEFPGFLVFAFFVVACLDERPQQRGVAPIATFEDLAKMQFLFDWRNDPAHSVSVFSRSNREKFLQVVEKWLSCLCAVRPVGESCMESLCESLSPLPLLENGGLSWLF